MSHGNPKKLWAFRISPEDHAEIKRRADNVRLSMTEYILRSALGEALDPSVTEERLDVLEAKVRKLEEQAYLGAYE